jgi:hypothetical protein
MDKSNPFMLMKIIKCGVTIYAHAWPVSGIISRAEGEDTTKVSDIIFIVPIVEGMGHMNEMIA